MMGCDINSQWLQKEKIDYTHTYKMGLYALASGGIMSYGIKWFQPIFSKGSIFKQIGISTFLELGLWSATCLPMLLMISKPKPEDFNKKVLGLTTMSTCWIPVTFMQMRYSFPINKQLMIRNGVISISAMYTTYVIHKR